MRKLSVELWMWVEYCGDRRRYVVHRPKNKEEEKCVEEGQAQFQWDESGGSSIFIIIKDAFYGKSSFVGGGLTGKKFITERTL